MKKNTSLAKTEANRKNALMSTGPKTPSGKAAVKWNALKHGLLAKEVVIGTGDGKESRTEFQAVLEAVTADFRPIGAVEEMLVEKIAVCYWRLRRVLRSEAGEIRAGLDTYTFDRAVRETQGVNELLEGPSWNDKGKEKELLLMVPGIKLMLDCVEGLRQDIQQHAAFRDGAEIEVRRLFGSENDSFGGDLLLYDWLATDDGQAPDTSSDGEQREVPKPDKCREIVLEMLAEKEDQLRNALDVIGEHESLSTRSGIAKRSLPGDGPADKLLRYEASIERSLYRALHELQCLQASRSSQAAPAPVVIDLDCDQPGT